MIPSELETRVRFHQTIASCMEDAESLCIEIRQFMLNAGLGELCFSIELLARECLSNAVIHGNGSAADKSLELNISIGKIWIRLEVKDQGSGFRWRNARKKALDDTASSGRGLQICTLYADRVRFNRSGNEVELWIRKCKPCERNSRHGRIHRGTRG